MTSDTFRRVGVLALVLAAVAAAATGCGGPSAKYEAKVTRVTSVDAAQMSATVQIHNTGQAAGLPTLCSVDLYDDGGKKVGSHGSWTLKKKLAAGASVTAVIPVDVDLVHQLDVHAANAVAECI